MKKKTRPIVRRLFRCEENNGDIKRIVTIAYEYNRSTKVLKYGASMYKQTKDEKDIFIKKNQRHTAYQRLDKCPVQLHEFEDDGSLHNFHMAIRKMLYKYGAKGDRVKELSL